jgi:Na+/H+ antiporter NhaA
MVDVSLLCVLLYALIIAVYYLVLLVINASDRSVIVVADPSVIEYARLSTAPTSLRYTIAMWCSVYASGAAANGVISTFSLPAKSYAITRIASDGGVSSAVRSRLGLRVAYVARAKARPTSPEAREEKKDLDELVS